MVREFNRTIAAKEDGFQIDVARTIHSDEWVHINIRPIKYLWPHTTLIVSMAAACELAQALLDATADESSAAGWETVDTDTD